MTPLSEPTPAPWPDRLIESTGDVAVILNCTEECWEVVQRAVNEAFPLPVVAYPPTPVPEGDTLPVLVRWWRKPGHETSRLVVISDADYALAREAVNSRATLERDLSASRAEAEAANDRARQAHARLATYGKTIVFHGDAEMLAIADADRPVVMPTRETLDKVLESNGALRAEVAVAQVYADTATFMLGMNRDKPHTLPINRIGFLDGAPTLEPGTLLYTRPAEVSEEMVERALLRFTAIVDEAPRSAMRAALQAALVKP